MQLLVIADTFPSRIQPWLLSSIEQAMTYGAEPLIVAGGRSGSSYPRKVDELGLLERTLYIQTGSTNGLRKAMSRLLGFTPRETVQSWRGLIALARNRRSLNPGIKSAAKAFALSTAAGAAGIDLMHAHAVTTAYEFLPIKRVLKVPYILTFHGKQPPGVPALADHKRAALFSELDRILVNTKFAEQQAVALGAEPQKIRIVPQGIDLERYPFSLRLPPQDGPVRLLSVGRLQADKGHLYAIEAVRLLREQGRNVEYRIVGTGPERGRLMATVRKLCVAECVTFVGEASDSELLREFASAHIFLFPSARSESGDHEETQGVAVQEAQASGLITIASKVGGVPEVIDPSCTFLVEDKNPPAIAKAVDHVLRNTDKWGTWQTDGRAWVEKNFDSYVVGELLWREYSDVIGNRSSPIDNSHLI